MGSQSERAGEIPAESDKLQIMKQADLITVVVCVLNGEKTLRNCIDSILNEKDTNFELVVVDNNSSDSTKEIIKEYESRDSRVRYVFKERKSLGAARNCGIENAKGSIIAMTDCDCVVPKGWLKDITRPIIDEGENIVMGFEYDLGNNFWSRLVQKANEEYAEGQTDGAYINTFDPKNFSAKASILKKFGFSDEQVYMEDFEFYVQIKSKFKIRFIKVIKVGHHHRTTLMSIIKTNFTRAYWTGKLYKDKKDSFPSLKKERMMTSHNTWKIILSPFIALSLFFKHPPSLAIYRIIVGTSWIAGTIYYKIKPI